MAVEEEEDEENIIRINMVVEDAVEVEEEVVIIMTEVSVSLRILPPHHQITTATWMWSKKGKRGANDAMMINVIIPLLTQQHNRWGWW